MPDLVDYVLYGRQELASHPRFQELFESLDVGVLDYADECLSEFRAGDRLADAMADERWSTWDTVPLTEIPEPGTRVVDYSGRVGTVAEIDSNYSGRPMVRTREGGTYHDPIDGGTLQKWVPIPLDAATLGNWH